MGTTLYLLTEFKTLKGWLSAGLFALLSLSGWIAWTAYHLAAEGIQFQPTLTVIGENILPNCMTYLDSYSTWILPPNSPMYVRVSALVLILSLLSILIWKSYEPSKKELKGRVIKLSIFLTLNYHLGMCLLEKANIWEVDRFVAIMYPFLILLFGISISDYLVRINAKKALIVKTILIVWLFYPVLRSIKVATFLHDKQCLLDQK